MQKNVLMFTTLSLLALAVTGCQESALDKPPGTYEKTSSATDANGTEYQKKTSTDVSVDSQGKKRAVVKSKTTKDPKGLLNKTTNSEVNTIEESR